MASRGRMPAPTLETVKHVRLLEAALTIRFRSEAYVGSTHDKRLAEAMPYSLLADSYLHLNLGLLPFTLHQVEIIMPRQNPHRQALTRAQKAENRRIAVNGD